MSFLTFLKEGSEEGSGAPSFSFPLLEVVEMVWKQEKSVSVNEKKEAPRGASKNWLVNMKMRRRWKFYTVLGAFPAGANFFLTAMDDLAASCRYQEKVLS